MDCEGVSCCQLTQERERERALERGFCENSLVLHNNRTEVSSWVTLNRTMHLVCI